MKVPVELKRKYLDRRMEDLQKLKSTVNEGDYSLAMRVGHQVKGNAVTFDFPQMAQYGVAIETAAKNEDKDVIFTIINEMENAISSAQQLFAH